MVEFFCTYKSNIKKTSIIISVILFFIIILSPFKAYSETEMNYPSDGILNYNEILIISSENDNSFWETDLTCNLLSQFANKNPNIRVRIESLNSFDNNYNDDDYINQQAALWDRKYGAMNLSMIIPIGDEALKFVDQFHTKNFLKDIPVVYGGINDSSRLSYYRMNNFTGVIKSNNIKSLIDSILKMEPDSTGLNIVLDDSISAYCIKNQFKDCIPYYDKSLNFNFISDTSLTDICEKLKSIDNNPIIIEGNFLDSSNTPVTPNDTINLIKKCTNSHIYTTNSMYINSNVVGGSILSTENHSKLIYGMAARVLNGESPSEIKSISDSSNILTFDAAVLHKYSIKRSSLPEASVIINDNWTYRGLSAPLAFALTIILIVSVVFSIVERHKRRKSDKTTKDTKLKYNQILINDKIKTEFFANFSHEIRTLLNVILSGLQLLELYKNTGRLSFSNKDDEIKLTYIRKNGLRLLRLINNLIDMTKIDSGFYNIDLEVKNVVEVVEDITMSTVEYAKSRGITIIFDTNEEEIYMPLDSEKLDRIVLNLLSNAIKYTPSDGTIYVTMNCMKDFVSVSVKDTGIGIPKELQSAMFDRFTQVNDEEKIHNQGSGIGLSLVKSLVEILGGTITLNSEPGDGSEFIFTLPIKDFNKTKCEIHEKAHKNIESKNEKILVELSDIQ